MAARSLNRVQLIGNLVRDPELRYTPNNKAVVTFSIATTRNWVTNGSKREETEFHRIVAWDKLAEICSQLLAKGSKVYVDGRIHYRSWTTAENVKKDVTEIIITDMILLYGGKQFSNRPAATSDSTVSSQPAPAAVANDNTGSNQVDLPDTDLDVIELPDDDLPFEAETTEKSGDQVQSTETKVSEEQVDNQPLAEAESQEVKKDQE